MNPHTTAGAVLLNKPADVSSFRALAPVKRIFRKQKVGHTGTLDPFATGLLVVLVGPLTRLAPELSGLDKEYEAVFTFGAETDTLDPTGTVVCRTDRIPELDQVKHVLPQFIGTVEQIPPKYSAIHVNGKRAYDLARHGIEPEIPARQVRVHAIEVLSWASPQLSVRIACGSGTYVRSLARDIGRACGSFAHVHSLHRTRVGRFHVNDSQTFDSGESSLSVIPAYEVMRMLDDMVCAEIRTDVERDIRHGKPFSPDMLAEPVSADNCHRLALFNRNRSLLALVTQGEAGYSYRFVVPGEYGQ